MTAIELRGAYAWNCPTCDCRNIVEAFANVIGDQRTEYVEGDEITYLTMEAGPVHDGTVICDTCHTYFEVEPPPPLLGGE